MKVSASHVRIPMRYQFGHARSPRNVADNVIVEVELSDGSRGWGESVPREYVTGETVASVLSALSSGVVPEEQPDLAFAARDLADRDLARELGGERAPQLAAACALELAILDAHARREQRPILDAVAAVPEYAGLLREKPFEHVRQTLTIGDDLEGALSRAGELHDVLDLKVKVGFGAANDRARVAALRRVFPDANLRGDANGVFDVESARVLLRSLQLSSIEEPLAERDLAGCAQLRRDGTVVMLDESLCTLDDAERAIQTGAVDLFNLRLSKCGGIFGTMRLVARARRAGLGWQLGCMVGESGVLSSLGRAFVARVEGALFFESTVPTRSLEHDLTDARLDHAPGTRMTPVPPGHGFGAHMLTDVLERYTVQRRDIANISAT
ncbi:MAG: enolase C-terminal domain-like protein [Polyangia bacterium]